MAKLLTLFLLATVLTSCYQTHSDADLRTTPATNNPNYIYDSNRGKGTPGVSM